MGCCTTKEKLYPNENWMGDLPNKIKKFPVINLAIPGSHDSMTYAINRSSKPSLDAEDKVRRIYKICPCFVRKWSKTQSADVMEQLKLGVRYLDLRISLKDNTQLYFAHGLYCMEVHKPLKEIQLFLEEHPKEVVILDFQHFYGLSDEHHAHLQHHIKKIFSYKIYGPDDGPLTCATLQNCVANEKQVIIIYRRYEKRSPEFWDDDTFPTPWPNVHNIDKLKDFLENRLKYRDPQRGYVSQCILTPDGSYIAKRFYSSLKGTAKTVCKKMSDWIEEQKPGIYDCTGAPVNVFIADFVQLYDGDFCNKVIELNKYLQISDKIF